MGVEVIDKLEIRVPAMTPVGKDLSLPWEAIRRGVPVPEFRPSRHYCAVGDLRPFGIQAIAHFSCKRGNQPNHKLELIETGWNSFDEILATIERAFRFDPLSASVMRVDLAADVEGMPVSWFESAVYAQFKRWNCDIGKLECSRIGVAEIETIYFGKRPNCFRVYNKTAEYRHQYSDLLRRWQGDQQPPPFAEVFGLPEDSVLTRIERQIGAGRVPDQLATVQLLQRNAPDFDPFERLRFTASSRSLPHPDEAGLSHWMQGMHLRAMAEQLGMHRLRKFLNRHSKGNAARILAKFAPFFPYHEGAPRSEHLYEIYRESVQRQIRGDTHRGKEMA